MISLTFSVLIALGLSVVRVLQLVFAEHKQEVKATKGKLWFAVSAYFIFVLGMNYIVINEIGVAS